MNRTSPWCLLAVVACALAGTVGASPERVPRTPVVPPVIHPGGPALTAAEVDAVVQRAATAVSDTAMAVTVVDRAGNVLAVWHRPGATDFEDERSLSLARTGAWFANNQAPLSSRTVRYLSGIHFPPHVRNQPNAALYGIENTNRVDYHVSFLPGKEYPAPVSLTGGPSLGITTGKVDVFDSDQRAVNPGGVPLYKGGSVVGGVGVAGVGSATDNFQAAEFAAFRSSQVGRGIAFPFPLNIVIFADGIALPFVSGAARDAVLAGRQLPGTAAGTFDPAGYRCPPIDGGIAADGYLVGPTAGSQLSAAEVDALVQRSVAVAARTRALIRVPLGSRTRMAIAVGDLNGDILALYRMPDSTIFSLDVSVAKARNVVYFSGPDRQPSDLPGLAMGTAVTNRTISFGAQPLFPPGIAQTNPGPFFDLYKFDTEHPGTQGQQPANPNQNGVVFFPGSVPLYRSGQLVGGLGISGDGVEQDDYVAFNGAAGFNAPDKIRADHLVIRRTRMPYLKFPRNPTR